MGLGGTQEEARGGAAEPAAGAWWPGALQAHRGFRSFIEWVTGEDRLGLCTVRPVCPIASAEGTAKYQELKANAEYLHIETGSPIPTDEQLMFEATGCSNKGHVYGFGSQSASITAKHRGGSNSLSSVPSLSSAVAHEAYIKRERRLWDTCNKHRTSSPAS
ncbi:hypothetical protein M9H77_29619 [Catharanthus roseus]|uniref:Uncharacterized protein n=1 Tax=Catharanthus roseus TaxID=4058 RepID=A0ACB9ZW85_CATRO|nr:hypothetical protein M9H77_29619 [Catharanthus roseus]